MQKEAFTCFNIEEGLISDNKKMIDAVQVESILSETKNKKTKIILSV